MLPLHFHYTTFFINLKLLLKLFDGSVEFFKTGYSKRNLKSLVLKYLLDRLKTTPSKNPFDSLNFFKSSFFSNNVYYRLLCPFKIALECLDYFNSFFRIFSFFDMLMSKSGSSSQMCSDDCFLWLPFVMFQN